MMVTDTLAAIRGISKQIRLGRLKAHDSNTCSEDAQTSKKYFQYT